ncbi:hypothetical protein B0H11DRAFT_2253043 [Mycena galericulata]|nr:hypothetical protein B0H11DRAFT_2253043 [Mycena galericulata]
MLLKIAKVYLVARSPDKAAAAIKRLEGETRKSGISIQLDLADLPSVRKAAESFLAQGARIINTSSSGHQFAPGEGMEFASLKGGPERDTWVKKSGDFMGRWKLYGGSKIGNIYVSDYFAKTYSDVLVSCTLHPGLIKTDLQWHAAGWLQVLGNTLLYPAPMGAYTQLWGAAIATPAQINGHTAGYIGDCRIVC